MDKGPWRARLLCVESEDSSHDVTLDITGDFATDDERDKYARWLANELNSCAALLARVAGLEKVAVEVLPLLNYIEATPDEGTLPGEFIVIVDRAKKVRAALDALEGEVMKLNEEGGN